MRWSLLFVLFSGFLFVSCSSGYVAPPSYGSSAVLSAVWTEAELAGCDEDRVIGRIVEPDCSAPPRFRPENALAPIPASRRGVIRSVDTGDEKVVALCFDLCERCTNRAGYQNELINYLRENQVPATFFAGGKWMRSHPEKTMQLMADPLFELGNHTWTHGNLALMNDAQIYNQLFFVQSQYELLREELAARAADAGLELEMAQVPPVPRVFRLPYGRSSARAIELVGQMGFPCVQWNVEGERQETELTPEQVAQNDLAITTPGSIYLVHANAVPRSTEAVIRIIVPALRAQGYRFVHVSELLSRGEWNTVDDGYFTEPGDNYWLDDYFLGCGTMHKRGQMSQ